MVANTRETEAHVSETLTARLVTQIKRLFRAHGLRYVDVADLMGVSEKSIKRYMAGRGITVGVLEKLCACAGITPFELVELATTDERTAPIPTTPAQEDALAGDVRLSITYYLLLLGWTPARITKEFSLDTSFMNALLTRLDRIGVITLYPGNRAKIRALLRSFENRSAGINRQMLESISELMHKTQANDPNTMARLGYFRLGPASLTRAAKLAQSFIEELRTLSKQDMDLDGKHVRWYAGCAFMTVQEPVGLWALRSLQYPVELPLTHSTATQQFLCASNSDEPALKKIHNSGRACAKPQYEMANGHNQVSD
jgi:transcriptional regulator with XRE-family HTH domain